MSEVVSALRRAAGTVRTCGFVQDVCALVAISFFVVTSVGCSALAGAAVAAWRAGQ